MSVVNTNVSASLAQAALAKNERALGTAMEQLSTGSKINSASDDAAGLAMAAKFTAQIKGLDMAVKNANDAVSMISTAEGALDEVTNMLQRMRELAVQSSNGTVTAEDRGYLDAEYQALDTEITRVANNTQWNGENILDGTAGAGGINGSGSSVVFQVSADYDSGDPIAGHAGISPGSFTNTDALATELNDANGGGSTDWALSKIGTASVTANTTLVANQTYEFTSGSSTITFVMPNDASTVAIGEHLAPQAAVAAGTASDTISVDFGDYANGSEITAVNGSDVNTQATANTAIGLLDTAIDTINSQRATFGSSMNRLEYAVDNMTNIANNAEASRSRIMDTNYAETTSELAKAQIIAQAGTAMLAQANQSSQSVLSLLR
jgi:flagellin